MVTIQQFTIVATSLSNYQNYNKNNYVDSLFMKGKDYSAFAPFPESCLQEINAVS